MFQTAKLNVNRARAGLGRKPSSDENAHPAAATTATGKLIKAAAHPAAPSLKSKPPVSTAATKGTVNPSTKAGLKRTVTAPLAAKANPARRNNTNLGVSDKETASGKPPGRSLRPRASSTASAIPTSATSRPAPVGRANVARPADAPVGPTLRKRSSTVSLASQPALRNRHSTGTLAPGNVSAESLGLPAASHALERLDSQATVHEESTGPSQDMDLDGDSTDTASVSDTTASLDLTLEHVSLDPTSLEYILATFKEDIDPLDTTMVTEYAPEIFRYMRQLEVRMLPAADYMARQRDLEWSMRGILIDWLVQVHQRFRLLPETLFLCVNYIDRFLSLKAVSLEKLQLVGATALLIAAKFEEIQVPSVADFVYMVDHAYTVDEVLKAERFMVSLLNFDLAFPGPLSFLRRISKADDYDIQTRTLAKYLIEVSIMDERFLPHPISQVAAAGHLLARQMLAKGAWTDAHVFYSGYTEKMLDGTTTLLIAVLKNPKGHNAIFEKYSDRKFMKASLFVQQWLAAEQAASPSAAV
ncbi:B-type cyclin [Tieghemiomyces parasiticus]|uniref:B-type cyclin n=1 Tax=Tieghemiomyces parasiticus TaxID=78921 RepID=A0A9W7ZTV5_9FUNG|nr:B-type cyclin [Tieghemiomyces parasiticus]